MRRSQVVGRLSLFVISILPFSHDCSQSGRFDRLKDVALEYAFLLKTNNMLQRQPAGAATT